jgi:hypothetical protein
MSRRSLVVIAAALGLLCAGPSALLAQTAPPVDQAEGGAADREIRIGSATLSGSAWLDGSMQTGAIRQQDHEAFRVRRGRIGVAGNLSPRLGYSLSGELTEPAVRNAFLVFRVSDHVSLRMGRANPISTLERGMSPLSLELIDRSGVTSALAGRPDIGVTIFNARPYRKWLGYAVNVTNGTGFNLADRNSSRAVSGRIALSPLKTPGLLVVVSGTRGLQGRGVRTRAGLGVDYRRGAWHLLVEGLRQRRDDLPASDGYVAMAAYRYRPKTPRSHFAQIEFASRVWVLNDHASVAGLPAEVDTDDGGGGVSLDAGIATAREFQAGVSYSFTSNVRLMGNLIAPFDDRLSIGPRVLLRWQVQF